CRFRDVLAVPVTGAWTLTTVADDGVQLFIDDEIVVDDDGTHSAREVDGDVALTAGDHDIEVHYFEAGGGERLEVRWQGPERQREAIPASALRRR
ncbi:MAG TPA: PA14 domain-containing protein, partial [Myxococcota bacterium]